LAVRRLVDAWLVLIGKRTVHESRETFEAGMDWQRTICTGPCPEFDGDVINDPWCGCESCDCKKTIEQIADTWTA
jgi:hypothetical protein